MAVAAIDTSVLYAAADGSDQRHEAAIPILRGIDDGSLPEVVVLDFVLAETMNGLTRRLSHEVAVDFLERLETNARFSVERVTGEAFSTGKALFRERHRLSLVDALVVGRMRTHGIEYLYSFDDDFDGLDGVVRLETVENPFGE